MDEADLAQIASEQHLADALARIELNRPRGASNIYCSDCGEPIPEARREAEPGCELCVDCQTERERKQMRA